MTSELDDLVASHNNVRDQAGKPALVVNEQLMRAAQNHAEWMRKNKCLSHKQGWIWGLATSDRLHKQNYAYSNFGENIAKGQNDVDEVMNVWLNSRPHHANILGNFQEIGVGRSDNYWCVVFGTQS
jgi:uncharacterized protein YkwD